ncbi:MAG TPA: hypothetical protein VMU02_06495 [bacterium]|nr:hypothetical protein [bacterium]
MAKEKIVRCKVSKACNGETQESVRFVPLEVFDLWKHLMTEKHSFAVSDECVSIWFDIDGDPNVSYSDANYVKVLRLSLMVYASNDGMYHKIVRYFPADAYAEIRPRILGHYSQYFESSEFPARIEETHGVWLRRDD